MHEGEVRAHWCTLEWARHGQLTARCCKRMLKYAQWLLKETVKSTRGSRCVNIKSLAIIFHIFPSEPPKFQKETEPLSTNYCSHMCYVSLFPRRKTTYGWWWWRRRREATPAVVIGYNNNAHIQEEKHPPQKF